MNDDIMRCPTCDPDRPMSAGETWTYRWTADLTAGDEKGKEEEDRA